MKRLYILFLCLLLTGCAEQELVTDIAVPEVVTTGVIQPVEGVSEEPCTFTATSIPSRYLQIYEAGVSDTVVESKRYEIDTDNDTANEVDESGTVISRGKHVLRDFYKELPKPTKGVIRDGLQHYTVTGSALKVANFEYDSLDEYVVNYICELNGSIKEISARQYYFIGQKRYFVGMRLLF